MQKKTKITLGIILGTITVVGAGAGIFVATQSCNGNSGNGGGGNVLPPESTDGFVFHTM
jgi:hypothetical protein